MLILKSNLLRILLALSLFMISCDQSEDNITTVEDFQLLGHEFKENGLVLYLKNFNPDERTITVDSKSPSSISKSKNISELFFDNDSNDFLSLRIKHPQQEESILLRNPNLAYKLGSFGKSFVVNYNQTLFIEEANTTITLLDVAEDSRCPDPLDNKGVEGFSTKREAGSCLHIPKTKILLKISTPRFKTFETPFYKEQLKEYEFSYGENSFTITEVNPEILKLNRIIPKNEYKITLSIEEVK